MKNRIAKPTHPYDPAWKAWNAQNPTALKSVGAAAAEGEGESEGEDDDAGNADGADDQDEKGGQEDEKGKKKGEVSPEVAALLQEVMQKKGKLGEAKTTIAELKSQLARFEGIDPDEVRAVLDAKKKSEEAELERKGEWDRLKARMAEEHNAIVSKKDADLNELQSQIGKLQSQIADLTVGHAFDNSPFIQSELVLTPRKARVVYGSHFEIEDGAVVAYDKPPGAANRTKIIDAKGDPVPFDEAIKRIVEGDPDRDNLLKSKMKAGADSGGKKTGTVEIDLGEKKSKASGLDLIQAGLAARKPK